MQSATRWAIVSITAIVAATALGCEKDEPKPAPPAKSANLPKAPPPPPASVAEPAPSATEAAPTVECPKDSAGDGTFNKPCEAKGTSRMMEVTWTGKMDDKGPTFRVVNKSSSIILFGKIAVYFYDKAGKQLEVQDTKENPPKSRPFHSCSGNMFAGVMKAGEKATLTFSCVKKAHVPEGATAIEAEMLMVGFTDEEGKKISSYWKNADLAPETRKKGGKK